VLSEHSSAALLRRAGREGTHDRDEAGKLGGYGKRIDRVGASWRYICGDEGICPLKEMLRTYMFKVLCKVLQLTIKPARGNSKGTHGDHISHRHSSEVETRAFLQPSSTES